MKEPSLQITAILSLVIHITFLFIALTTMKQANHFVVPSPYIISLVSPEGEESAASVPEVTAKEIPEYTTGSKKMVRAPENTKEYTSDRIAAIKAIRKAKRIIGLRNIISIKGSGSLEEETETSQPAEDAGEEAMLSSYFDKIGKEIRQRWAFPEAWGKDLEAIISVTIMLNGSIKINRIEKSSGNLLFDGSVLKAIIKAPVSPPPYEMEKSLRFTP